MKEKGSEKHIEGVKERARGRDRRRKETSDVVCPIAITPSGTFLRQRQSVPRKSLKCIVVGSSHCELWDCNIRISSDRTVTGIRLWIRFRPYCAARTRSQVGRSYLECIRIVSMKIQTKANCLEFAMDLESRTLCTSRQNRVLAYNVIKLHYYIINKLQYFLTAHIFALMNVKLLWYN